MRKYSNRCGLCENILSKDLIRFRELARLLGNVAWAIPAIPFAQAHARQLQNFFITRSASSELNFSVRLSDEARADVFWWRDNISRANGKLIFPDCHETILSDASLKGWGAFSAGQGTHGPWSVEDRGRHINELELIAAFNALKAFLGKETNIAVNIFLDNMTAVAYINKGGGSRSRTLTQIASELLSWCEARSISIQASFIPGKNNIEADFLSRLNQDPSDWMLDKLIFAHILDLFGVEIDLFAATWNRQLPKFVSWKPQPEAFAVNAFTFSWKGLSAYAFPPFNIISLCLEKVRKERAEIVLVTPLWQGQHWFPTALEMAADVPRIIPPHNDLLLSPTGSGHPLCNSMALVVWSISGKPSRVKVFRNLCATSSFEESVEPLELRTKPRGAIGKIGAVRGVPIPCQLI